MKTLLYIGNAFVIAALLSAAGYFWYINAYTLAQLNRLQGTLLIAPQWRYGVIQSIDATSSTMIFTSNTGTIVRVTIEPNAFIGRQDMVSQNGVYTAALPVVPGILGDLQAGQQAALVISKDPQGSFVTSMILVGNPL